MGLPDLTAAITTLHSHLIAPITTLGSPLTYRPRASSQRQFTGLLSLTRTTSPGKAARRLGRDILGARDFVPSAGT